MSKGELDKWNIVDYTDWGNGTAPVGAYKSYVTKALCEVCLTSWRSSVVNHVSPCLYLLLQNYFPLLHDFIAKSKDLLKQLLILL